MLLLLLVVRITTRGRGKWIKLRCPMPKTFQHLIQSPIRTLTEPVVLIIVATSCWSNTYAKKILLRVVTITVVLAPFLVDIRRRICGWFVGRGQQAGGSEQEGALMLPAATPVTTRSGERLMAVAAEEATVGEWEDASLRGVVIGGGVKLSLRRDQRNGRRKSLTVAWTPLC